MKKIFAALLAVAFTVAAVCLGACGGTDTVKKPLSMQLNRDEVRLYEDGQIKLEAIISPVTAGSAQLTWESDNTAVATVNEGVVTAVGAAHRYMRGARRRKDGGRFANCAELCYVAA